MPRIRLLLLLLVLAGSGAGQLAGAAELYVIVHASNTTQKLEKRDVVALFTGRLRNFPGGGAVQPYDHPAASKTRADFYRALTGMDLARINSYWARLLFTGQVQPPKALADDAAVLAMVRSNPQAIGYVATRPNHNAVRVVFALVATGPESGP
jgi:ABC-type phosphate transport system substrate-binding protein